MNSKRMLIVGLAFVASIVAVLFVRALVGGGAPKAKAEIIPPHPATSEVLVASTDLQPGTALTADSVHWQTWPKSAVDASFITHDAVASIDTVIKGAVVRAPMVSGEPLTAAKIVHADSAGIMAAMVTPGMRAVSIGISTESGAGGFILPNDRVDVLLTEQVSDSPRRFAARTLLQSVRVLAVDQTYREDHDQKVVLAKTATLELAPREAELVERAQATGTLSLSLRALGDGTASKSAAADTAPPDEDRAGAPATVISYGIAQTAGGRQGD